MNEPLRQIRDDLASRVAWWETQCEEARGKPHEQAVRGTLIDVKAQLQAFDDVCSLAGQPPVIG